MTADFHTPRLRRLAHILNVLALIGLAVLPVALLVPMVQGDAGARYVSAYADIPIAVVPEGGVLATLVGLDLVPLLVTMAVMWSLHRLFRLYADAAILSGETSMRLRRLGLLLIALAVLAPIGRTLDILVLTLGNPPGERMLAIGFGSPELGLLLAGGLVLLIGQAMAEAARAVSENQGFV